MKSYFLLPVLALYLAACGTSNVSAPAVTAKPGAVTVEVAYLNHAPVRPVVSDIDKLLATYGDRVSATHYDFDTPDGQAFAKVKGITEHTPLAIYVNGSMQFKVNGRNVEFFSFPQGQGTGMVADGDWTMDDLHYILDQSTSQTK